MLEVLVCCGCKFTMPYSQERSDIPCPKGYDHDSAYPIMERKLISSILKGWITLMIPAIGFSKN